MAHYPGAVSDAADSTADDHRSSSVRAAGSAGVPGTLRRAKDRRRAGPLAKIGMAVFCIGLIAILADVALFASGSRDLPLWLNLVAILAPVGLGIGLVGTVVGARRGSD